MSVSTPILTTSSEIWACAPAQSASAARARECRMGRMNVSPGDLLRPWPSARPRATLSQQLCKEIGDLGLCSLQICTTTVLAAMAMDRINWDNLRLFLAVVRAQSAQEAARRMEVDHSTITRRLHRLEKELGAQLFERTPAGHLLTT